MAKSQSKKPSKLDRAKARLQADAFFKRTCDLWVQELNQKGLSTIANEIRGRVEAQYTAAIEKAEADLA